MSIREEERDEAWWDLEHQTLSGGITVSSNELDGSGQDFNWDPVSYTPAGSLDRGEVAELVGIEWDMHSMLVEEGNAGTTPGTAMWEYGLIMDQSQNFKEIHDNLSAQNGLGLWDGFESTEQFRLLHIYMNLYAAFNDTANGTGGGGQQALREGFKNFRRDFETGPVFFHDDDLLFNMFLDSNDNDNQNIKSSYFITLYWDIFEVQDPLESAQDIIGRR